MATPSNSKTVFQVIVGENKVKNRSHASSGVVLEYNFDIKANRSHCNEHGMSELSHDPIESDRSQYIGLK